MLVLGEACLTVVITITHLQVVLWSWSRVMIIIRSLLSIIILNVNILRNELRNSQIVTWCWLYPNHFWLLKLLSVTICILWLESSYYKLKRTEVNSFIVFIESIWLRNDFVHQKISKKTNINTVKLCFIIILFNEKKETWIYHLHAIMNENLGSYM